jgi:hypothetical protein
MRFIYRYYELIELLAVLVKFISAFIWIEKKRLNQDIFQIFECILLKKYNHFQILFKNIKKFVKNMRLILIQKVSFKLPL